MNIRIDTIKKHLAAIIIISVLSLGICLAFLGGLFNFLEYKLYDFRVISMTRFSRPLDDIIPIFIDQDSIDWAQEERGWGWPWPREAYAEIIDFLNEAGAKSLAFDILFTEPSVYGSEDDMAFARAAERFGGTIQVTVFSNQTGNINSWPDDLQTSLFMLNNFESVYSLYENLNPRRAWQDGQIRALMPIQELRQSAGAMANVTNWPDSDGIYRRNILFTIFDGKAVPGMAAASLMVSGETAEIYYNERKRQIEWGDYIIPVDRDGRSILRFHGLLNLYVPYSAWEILQSAEALRNGQEPILNPEDFKDRYTLMGLYAQGLLDIFSSPVSSVYSGMGFHITMLDNLLQQNSQYQQEGILPQSFIRESPLWIGVIIIILTTGLIVFFALYIRRIVFSVSSTILFLALFIGFAFGAYYYHSLWIPMAAPMIAAVLSFITSAVYNFATEGRKKQFIKSAFSQYLSSVVIENIISDPSKLNLGGETRNMTAIFTDVQRFSSISEALQKEYGTEGPRVLVNLLNLYLTEMSDIILANNGTIDKYEGDAIIAFFGAPVMYEDHAALACRSALLMKRQEALLLDKVMDPAGEFYSPLSKLIESKIIPADRPLYTRLGINSGDMVVGNMGTPRKMNYTIMGNAVNLAARLEGVNKQYNSGGILISEYTRNKIGDEFIVRGLSRVRVVGIDTPLRLYEVLEFKKEASKEMQDMVKSWDTGFEAYEGMDFKTARDLFYSIMQKNEKDMVAKLYFDRCEKYLATPPVPEKWDDGVDNLTEK